MENDMNNIDSESSDDEAVLGNDEALEVIHVEGNGSATDSEDEEPVDDADAVLRFHKGPVFTCAVSPDGKTIVTGGKDDVAYVWDVETRTTLFTCVGHTDSVTSVGFSYKSKFVATGDMGGTIKVWDLLKRKIVDTYDTDDLMWIRWHPKTNALLAGTVSGNAYMWEIPSGRSTVYVGNNSRNECGLIMYDGKTLVFGFENGRISIWHIKGTQASYNIPHPKPGNTSGVTCMDNSDKVVAAGFVDGTAVLYNTMNGNVLGQLHCSTQGEENASVEAILFHNFSNRLYLATGTARGEITLWDSSRMVRQYNYIQEVGLTRILWHPKRLLICASGTDGNIRVVDAHRFELVQTLRGHNDAIHDMAITSDGINLISTSEDHTCRVFNAAF